MGDKYRYDDLWGIITFIRENRLCQQRPWFKSNQIFSLNAERRALEVFENSKYQQGSKKVKTIINWR